MREQFLVFGSSLIGAAEVAEAVDSLESGWIGSGPKVRRFEQMLESYVEVPHERCVSSSMRPCFSECAASTSARATGYGSLSSAATAWDVFGFALRRMLRSDGLPIFQRRRLWANRTPHAHWMIGPMLLALSHLPTFDSSPEGDSTTHRFAQVA